MTTISIATYEDIHPLCLMYGLKSAYRQFPRLVHNVMATPPPYYRSPNFKLLFIGSRLNVASVQYFKNNITILYDESRATGSEMDAFSRLVVEEYLRFRHPYLVIDWRENRAIERSSDRLIVEITPCNTK